MGSRLRDTVRYLFEMVCHISAGDQGRESYIKFKYPKSYNNEEELRNILKFTFPCKMESSFVQNYSFVMTSEDSKYTFGFCRFDPKTNSALVLLSHLPWHDIFYKLLNCIANLMNSTENDELTYFLDACRIPPPMPGHTLKVSYNAGHNVFSCQNPGSKLPSIPENCNLTEYFSAVDTKCMAGLWAALLHERRVAIIATKPSRLSACVQAANATLFPMSWQHIFIPILPRHLVDYLLAPMPFLIGVPRSVMETVRMSDIGDVVILDVDANELRSPYNDLDSLPHELVVNLKKALSDKNALGDAVSRAFLRALVCLIGGYRDAISLERGERISFNPEQFVTKRKSMQQFLRKILQSQIFQQFIDERLELLNSGRGFNDEFEMECSRYAEGNGSGSGHRLKQQYRDWAKNFKKEGGVFFKNVRDKANPAVQSAVKTVRQGGRNVKTVVKVLTSKMPKPPSEPSSANTTLTDDSRFSGASETAVSHELAGASPAHDAAQDAARDMAREPPPSLPLDLLTEMDMLFPPQASRRDSLPHSSRCDPAPSYAEKAKTLSPSIPPRLPERPNLPVRYPIIPIRRLLDLSDAPIPPPRTAPGTAKTSSQFVSNIIKNEINGDSDFHTSTIRFADAGKDKAKLKLTLSSNLPKSQSNPGTSTPCNGNATKPPFPTPTPIEERLVRNIRPILKNPIRQMHEIARTNGRVRESTSLASDLIKLEDSPDIEDFDPLKRKEKVETSQPPKVTTDSALLTEYGLDFSQFGFNNNANMANTHQEATTSSNVPKTWTTFN